MRQSARMNSSSNKPNSTTRHNIGVFVASLVVMLLVAAILTFQMSSFGKDYIARSKSISSLKSEGKELLTQNRTLRAQLAFIRTPHGREIIARRILYKHPNEKYAIVTADNPK